MVTPLGHRVEAACERGEPLLLPGAYDALSARLAEAAGFDAIYLTGAGLANARFGVPDVGLVTLDGLVDHVAAIDDVVGAALVVDADTGFGNAVNVTRTVRRLERAGADAIQLEDQVMPEEVRPLRRQGGDRHRGDGAQAAGGASTRVAATTR